MGLDLKSLTISKIRHPEYEDTANDWLLWRDTYASGRQYVERYLERFTIREAEGEFLLRKKLSPVPAFAQAAVDDVVNNIFQRMTNITRAGGSDSYQGCLDGSNNGVDLTGSSMNYFMGKRLLPEMLTMKKVGIYVDCPPADGSTLLDIKQKKIRPYLYMYNAEEICNWIYDFSDEPNEFRAILLRETYNTIDPKYMMPIGLSTRYRFMYINADGYVNVEYYNDSDEQIWHDGSEGGQTITLPLKRIPFVVFEIPHSLLKNAAKHQIALLNLASSDVYYCLKANYPFYVEQRDYRTHPQFARPTGSGNPGADGTAAGAEAGGEEEIQVGAASGRAYPIGADAPSFIHPSPEPLKVSMEKQEQLKAEIRQLINLAVQQLQVTKQASADSKAMDSQGLEAGLSAIGLELERGERKIAEFWSMYETGTKAATVSYPPTYTIKSDMERREDAAALGKLLPQIPSMTGQREVAKLAIGTLIGNKVSREVLEKINGEIDKAAIVANDPTVINEAVLAGYLDKGNAAAACLYPTDAVEKANKEQAERLALIAKSQATAAGPAAGGDPAARGVPDASVDPNAGAKEKQAAKVSSGGGGVRGPGKGAGQ